MKTAAADEGAGFLGDLRGNVILLLPHPHEISPSCEVLRCLGLIDLTFISINSLGMEVIF